MMRRSPLGNTPKSSLRVADGRARMDLPSAVCGCGRKFVKLNAFQAVCIPCARQAGPKKRKEEATKTRAAKEALKTPSNLMREVQREFNAYIRVRDAAAPCVSCGCEESSKWQASHYRSVGSAPELRFSELNVHKSCPQCNLYLHGNPIPYRTELIRRIGSKAVEALEGPHPPAKWSRDDLREMRGRYRRLGRELTKQREAE